MTSFPYFDDEGFLNVEASMVDDVNIQFVCPRCVYRKKPVIHYHGSSGQYHNRVEHRVAHCDKSRVKQFEDYHKGVNIHVTDNTDFKIKGKKRISPIGQVVLLI